MHESMDASEYLVDSAHKCAGDVVCHDEKFCSVKSGGPAICRNQSS
jgi:hypothetical protein